MSITKFKYYRDKDRNPIITMCTIQDGSKNHVGIAICSVRDNPHKATGRAVAHTRAAHARYLSRSNQHYADIRDNNIVSPRAVPRILDHVVPQITDKEWVDMFSYKCYSSI